MLSEQQSLEKLVDILKKINCNRQEDISLASVNYAPTGKTFQLYVGVEGTVVGIDENDGAVNRHFIAGYHPIVFKQITKLGTDASSLAALFY